MSKGKRPLLVQIDQTWDEDVRDTVALDDAAQASAKQDAVHVDRTLRPRWRDADQSANARQGERIDRLAKNLGLAGAFERVVEAAFPDLVDGFDRIALGRVDRVRGPQLARQPETRGVGIDGDDRATTGDVRAQHGGEPHRSAAEDRDRRAGSRVERVHDRTRPGLDPAAERAQQLERNVVRNLDRVALAGQRVRRERRLVEEVAVHDLVALAQRRRTIRSRGREVAAVEIEAVSRIVFEAGLAASAGQIAEDDRVTGLHLGDRIADLLDDARTLVTEHARERDGEVLVPAHEIRVADPRSHDPHDELVAAVRGR